MAELPDRARIVIYSTPFNFAQNLWIRKGNMFIPVPVIPAALLKK